MKKYQSDTFCVLPWIGMELRSDGQVAVCSDSLDSLEDKNGEKLHLSLNSLDQILESPTLSRIKSNLINNVKDKNCKRCWVTEKAAGKSERMLSNKRHNDLIEQIQINSNIFHTPIAVDIKLGNHCNQKCRICNANASSMWVKENLALHSTDGLDRANLQLQTMSIPDSRNYIQNWFSVNLQFWKSFETWLPEIKQMRFSGGEPLLIKDNRRILDFCIKNDLAKNQDIIFSTNGSVFPNDLINDVFPYFKSVGIYLSIDGTEQKFEYMRNPAKWKNILENYKKFKATNYFAGIHMSVSAFDAFYLPESLSFWEDQLENKVFVHCLEYPEEMSVKIFPKKIKLLVAKKLLETKMKTQRSQAQLDYVVRFMMTSDEEKHWNLFCQTVKKHDHHRKESFEQTFSEFVNACADLRDS